MKKTLLVKSLMFLTMGAFLFTACSKLTTLNLNKTYSGIEFTIKAPQAAGTFELQETIEADLAQLAKEYGFDINKIESAELKSIRFIIKDTNPTPVTFDVVEAATCSFAANGVTITQVGTDDATQTSPTQMDINLNGVDVAPYLKATNFDVKLSLTTNAAIDHDVPMEATIDVSLKVKPLK